MESISGSPVVSINPPPLDLQRAYDVLFSKGALDFVAELITTFEEQVEKLHWNRLSRKSRFHLTGQLPKFSNTKERCDPSWKIRPVPPILRNRRLDLGDVSPANTKHFVEALNAHVQGIQVDFDDGHCPTWRNQIIGLHNVYKAVHGQLDGARDIRDVPVLMLRPRAWNMIDHNIIINGREAPGPLVDFGMIIYHNYNILVEARIGPFFYLSKLEGAAEARLWNDIFIWTQRKLRIPKGTIKACVLIENILSAFEMDEILFELKDHSLGLNCGIWDYAASVICKFGSSPKFVLPDRNKYVNMQRHFLKKYMQLVVKTCHTRGAHATGGMAAFIVTEGSSKTDVIKKVVNAKRLEIETGVDGFMVYDLKLVPYVNKLWNELFGSTPNQLYFVPSYHVTAEDLLQMPTGGVTWNSLKHNIEVAILFIFHWLKGKGHFFHKGAVEDSATAEISRSQVWQWIRHKAIIEDNGNVVTKELVQHIISQHLKNTLHKDAAMHIAASLFIEIATAFHFPDFITTYLNDHYVFRQRQAQIKAVQLVPKL